MDKIEFKSPINLLMNKITSWFEAFILILPNLLIATLVIFAFIMASKAAARVYCKVTRIDNSAVNRLIESMIRIFIITLGVVTALGILSLDKALTSVLAGAGVVGLALGFAFQEIISNFICGVIITIKKPYVEGDIVQIDNFVGTVDRINLRTTDITTFEGLDVLIPNKDMFTKPVTNLTKTARRRVELKVGVSYSEDLRKVERLVKEALKDLPDLIQDTIDVFYSEFADSSINFNVYFWVNFPGNGAFPRSKHEAVMRIKETFDAHEITIPFPMRTLEIKNSTGAPTELID